MKSTPTEVTIPRQVRSRLGTYVQQAGVVVDGLHGGAARPGWSTRSRRSAASTPSTPTTRTWPCTRGWPDLIRPTVLVDGIVSGVWELDRRAGLVTVELFTRLGPADTDAVVAEGHRLLRLAAPDVAPRSRTGLGHGERHCANARMGRRTRS
ncbi:DNA glycosylase AlkZ-like family protein [Micromonospora sp. NPDC047620]|uniref:DNA glycosylase AlkZ-like family protein n=1 Tax=Micromonospora sp. NPDC047620 TaxID=3364251 RepID=UPI0037234204